MYIGGRKKPLKNCAWYNKCVMLFKFEKKFKCSWSNQYYMEKNQKVKESYHLNRSRRARAWEISSSNYNKMIILVLIIIIILMINCMYIYYILYVCIYYI